MLLIRVLADLDEPQIRLLRVMSTVPPHLAERDLEAHWHRLLRIRSTTGSSACWGSQWRWVRTFADAQLGRAPGIYRGSKLGVPAWGSA